MDVKIWIYDIFCFLNPPRPADHFKQRCISLLYSLVGPQIQQSDMDEKENLLLSEVEEEIQEEEQCEPKEDEKVGYL